MALKKILLPVAGVAAGLALWFVPHVSGQAGGPGQPSTAKFEWPMYTADLRGSKYTPAAQIDAPTLRKADDQPDGPGRIGRSGLGRCDQGRQQQQNKQTKEWIHGVGV